MPPYPTCGSTVAALMQALALTSQMQAEARGEDGRYDVQAAASVRPGQSSGGSVSLWASHHYKV